MSFAAISARRHAAFINLRKGNSNFVVGLLREPQTRNPDDRVELGHYASPNCSLCLDRPRTPECDVEHKSAGIGSGPVLVCRRKPAESFGASHGSASDDLYMGPRQTSKLAGLFSFRVAAHSRRSQPRWPNEPAGSARAILLHFYNGSGFLVVDCCRMPLRRPQTGIWTNKTIKKIPNEYGGRYVQAINISCRSLAFFRGRARLLRPRICYSRLKSQW